MAKLVLHGRAEGNPMHGEVDNRFSLINNTVVFHQIPSTCTVAFPNGDQQVFTHTTQEIKVEDVESISFSDMCEGTLLAVQGHPTCTIDATFSELYVYLPNCESVPAITSHGAPIYFQSHSDLPWSPISADGWMLVNSNGHVVSPHPERVDLGQIFTLDDGTDALKLPSSGEVNSLLQSLEEWRGTTTTLTLVRSLDGLSPYLTRDWSEVLNVIWHITPEMHNEYHKLLQCAVFKLACPGDPTQTGLKGSLTSLHIDGVMDLIMSFLSPDECINTLRQLLTEPLAPSGGGADHLLCSSSSSTSSSSSSEAASLLGDNNIMHGDGDGI